jgi:hypothetical protein
MEGEFVGEILVRLDKLLVLSSHEVLVLHLSHCLNCVPEEDSLVVQRVGIVLNGLNFANLNFGHGWVGL